MLKLALRRLLATVVNGSYPLASAALVSLLILAGLVSTSLNPTDILERECPALQEGISESFDSYLSRIECILFQGSL